MEWDNPFSEENEKANQAVAWPAEAAMSNENREISKRLWLPASAWQPALRAVGG